MGGGKVRIPHSHVNLTVPEYFLHCRQIDTIHDHVTCRRVAEIMKMEILDFRVVTGAVECIINGSLSNPITPRPTNKIISFAVL